MKSNFEYLKRYWPALAQIGAAAENYLYSDPNACLYKLGIFAERLILEIFAFEHIPEPTIDNTHSNRIRMLKREGLIPKKIDDILYAIRKTRNSAVHNGEDSVDDAKILLQMTYNLSTWFIAGTIGVVGEVPEILDGMNLTENAVRVCNISINKTFLCYVMLSELVQQQFQEKTHQVAMPKLALERILGTLIPVCPVKEQQHIVFAINRALQIADTIEIQKDVLFELVAATKSKILDLAIRGKLVPQDPNDEPASVLLERIRAKKEELIKQGKIKRDKKESVIFKGDDNSYYEKIGNKITCIDDFLPFDIPDTWTWARLKNIGDVIGGGTPKTNNPNYWDGEIPWVTPADLSGYENMYTALIKEFARRKQSSKNEKNGGEE